VRVRHLVAAAALAVAATACSATVLDRETMQDEISSGIEEQTGFAAEVTCPEGDRPIEAGDVFDCSASFDDGTEQAVRVTQLDAEGNIEWELQ